MKLVKVSLLVNVIIDARFHIHSLRSSHIIIDIKNNSSIYHLIKNNGCSLLVFKRNSEESQNQPSTKNIMIHINIK
jgi:hypothetical protein